jgi:hypothetical protein
VLPGSGVRDVQNVGVSAPRRRLQRPVLSLAALGTSAVLGLTGCSGGSDASGAASSAAGDASSGSSSSAPASGGGSPSSTASSPGPALTDPGSALSFGEPATVAYRSAEGSGSTLRLTVNRVSRGRLADFTGFILDDAYKRQASYYYARVRVTNVGDGDVGGTAVPLWGVNAANTLLPAVNFTTGFAPCPSQTLPKTFGAGRTMTTCLVFLAPDHGSLEAVSYRPSQAFDPITWKGPLTKPVAPKKAKAKGSTKPRKKRARR